MMKDHYSENELQQYIDGTVILTEKKQIEEHLLHCESCGKKYEHYLKLFIFLEQDTGFKLSSDFSEKVIHSIENLGERNFFQNYREFFWSFLALLSGLGISLYFTGLDFFSFRMPKITIPQYHIDLTRFENIYSLLSNMHVNFFICVLLIIVLITFFDQILVKNKFNI